MLSALQQAACLGFPVLLAGTHGATRRATRSRPARVGGTFGSNASKHLATWSEVPVLTGSGQSSPASSHGPGRGQDTGPGHAAAPPRSPAGDRVPAVRLRKGPSVRRRGQRAGVCGTMRTSY